MPAGLYRKTEFCLPPTGWFVQLRHNHPFERARSPLQLSFSHPRCPKSKVGMSKGASWLLPQNENLISTHYSVTSFGALPDGTGRSGMVGSKELDLCYNFHFLWIFDFGDLAIRKSGTRGRPSDDSHSS